MKPAPFEYVVPNSLTAALETMATYGDDIKPLAGGQSLIPAMNFRLARPAILLDLNPLTDLAYIRQTNNGDLHLGAMTRHYQVEHAPLVARYDPLLHAMMPHIAHPQIRNRGTFGGSLAHADPAAELPVLAVARQARLRLQSATGERWLAAQDFFAGLFTTLLEPGELLVEIVLPAMPARTGSAFLEMARRHGDYALAGVAVLVTLGVDGVCQQARLVYLNVGDVPMVAAQAAQMLVGQPPAEDLFAAVAERAAQEEIDPTDDIHASSRYKRHLARVLTQRALRQAVAEAQQAHERSQ